MSSAWLNISKIQKDLAGLNIDVSNLMEKVNDNWIWKGDSTGLFSVASMRRIMSNVSAHTVDFQYDWCKWVPGKVNLFFWRAEMDRIPTRDSLAKRNIQVPSLLCPLCNNCEESIYHLLVSCEVANMLWSFVSSWCKLTPIFAFSVRDLYLTARKGISGNDPFITAIILTACWCLWKARNDACFNGTVPSWIRVKEEMQSLSFLWVKGRARRKELTWERWCQFKVKCQ